MYTEPKVDAIIVNMNDRENTLECIQALKAIGYPCVTIVVVDNASRDGSVEAFRKRYSDIAIIENEGNIGYAAGNNVGMRYAIADAAQYVWILNSDVIPERASLRALMDAVENDETLGIVGPVIYHYPETERFWNAGYRFDLKRGYFIPIAESDVSQLEKNAIVNVDIVQGCSMLIKVEMLRKVGFFDERFFMYHEEADLCMRAQRAHYRLGTVKGSVVYHKGFASVGGKESSLCLYLRTRNAFYFIRKNSRGLRRLRYWAYSFLESVVLECARQLRRYLRFHEKGCLSRIWAILAGFTHSLMNRYGKGPFGS